MSDLEIKKEIVNKKRAKKTMKKSNSLVLWLILCILVVASGVALFFNLKVSGHLDKIFPPDDNFYLVYLNLGNGNTTYYGQGLKKCGDYLILKNPFFLQSTKDEKTGDTVLSLEKLEDSFYRPLSEMKISKYSVIFTQQLKADSQLVKEYDNLK